MKSLKDIENIINNEFIQYRSELNTNNNNNNNKINNNINNI